VYTLYFTKEAQKDAHKLAGANLKDKTLLLLELIKNDPFKIPPPVKKLKGKLNGYYSRRINLQHRLFYQVNIKRRG
jgi:Txe/YoeB family toxin of toxin-antitoxin system